MMTARQTIALMRHNARRCAASRHRVCTCRCGGKFHGQAHPAEWLDTQARVIQDQLEQAGQEQLPMVAP